MRKNFEDFFPETGCTADDEAETDGRSITGKNPDGINGQDRKRQVAWQKDSAQYLPEPSRFARPHRGAPPAHVRISGRPELAGSESLAAMGSPEAHFPRNGGPEGENTSPEGTVLNLLIHLYVVGWHLRRRCLPHDIVG